MRYRDDHITCNYITLVSHKFVGKAINRMWKCKTKVHRITPGFLTYAPRISPPPKNPPMNNSTVHRNSTSNFSNMQMVKRDKKKEIRDENCVCKVWVCAVRLAGRGQRSRNDHVSRPSAVVLVVTDSSGGFRSTELHEDPVEPRRNENLTQEREKLLTGVGWILGASFLPRTTLGISQLDEISRGNLGRRIYWIQECAPRQNVAPVM